MTSTTECRTLDRTLRRRGAYVFAVFGFVWAMAGSSIAGRAAWVVLVVAAVVSVTVAVLGHRSGKNGAGERRRALPEGWGRSVGVVNIVQIVAIAVTDDRVSRSRVTCHDDVPQDRLIHAVLELSVGSRVTNLETRLGEDRHDLFAGGHQGVPGNTQGTTGA